MTAHLAFKRAFSEKSLKRLYSDKIQYHLPVGLDNVVPDHFNREIDQNISIISRKALSGTYSFTRYREVLISKGRGKEPRVISIPTARDYLALAAFHFFLKQAFSEDVSEPLLHTTIGNISEAIHTGAYSGYVKADITHFYPSIDHKLLLKRIRKRVRKKEALSFLERAISTETQPRGKRDSKRRNDLGVPEGLSISNILADIFLSDLGNRITGSFSGVRFFRYVDDILILCDFNQAESIKDSLISILKDDYSLDVNNDKTKAGALNQGVPFLGYVFYHDTISIRPEAIRRVETAIEDLFRLHKHKKITTELFLWKLNLRIVGCILNEKKYGWLFYYSQSTDLGPLFHLDWLMKRLFIRFRVEVPKDLRSFVHGYFEITKNVSRSKYLINADIYSTEKKRKILMEVYKKSDLAYADENTIKEWFNKTMFREVRTLEKDIQRFS